MITADLIKIKFRCIDIAKLTCMSSVQFNFHVNYKITFIITRNTFRIVVLLKEGDMGICGVAVLIFF